jgi:5-methylcytosine-specific restriction endonuclease McrA
VIKLSDEDKLRHKDTPLVLVKMTCMICMAFPNVAVQKENTAIWEQVPNPVPSNRICLHLKHKLECPYCEMGVEPEEVVRERYFIESAFREEIFKRDKYTCQACGYKQTLKPNVIKRRAKGEDEATYLHRRFISELARHNNPKSLVGAHYSKRYGEETYDARHDLENARTLCGDCHNMETAKHQMEEWAKRMNECPWLKNLE